MKQKLLYAFIALYIFALDGKAQSWVLTGNTPGTTDFLGSTGTNPLNLKTTGSQPINFYTNGTQYMTILGSTNPGFVGIGTATPGQLLEISGGNINVSTATNYYMLGGNNMLGHKGDVSNLFGGVGAGFTNGNYTSYNTYVGNGAGYTGPGTSSSPNNTKNTLLGAGAGYFNTSTECTFLGFQAGYNQNNTNNTSILGNTFVGSEAGLTNVSGGESVFVGYKAGYSILNTSNNTFVGWKSGALNVANGNTFLGEGSGAASTSGDYNVFIGVAAGSGSVGFATGGSNTAVGSYALNIFSTGYANVANGVYALGSNTGGSRNIAIGDSALFTNSSGHFNNATGYKSLYKNTANNNNAYGHLALYSNTLGYANIGIGNSAAFTCTTGVRNISIGDSAQFTNISKNFNTAVGYKALYANNNSSYNSAFGHLALTNSISDGPNDAFGYNSLTTNSTGTSNAAFGYLTLSACLTGASNTAVGNSCLKTIISNSYNTAVGKDALLLTTGASNTALGYGAGATNSTGSTNTTLGYSADVSSSGLTNATAVGANAKVYSSNTIQIGDNNVTGVGIGNNNAAFTINAKFDVLTSGATISAGSSSYASHEINSNTGSGSFGFPPSYSLVYGTYGESNGSGNAYTYNYGGAFKAANAYRCVGVSGTSVTSATTGLSYGGYFNSSYSAASAGNSFGSASFTGTNGALNVAVYGSASSSSNNTLPNWAGYFVNDVYITGNGWISAAWNIISDKKYKKNIDSISNPLAILKKLNPKSYNYDTANADGFSFPYEKQYGFIAQEVQQVLPELVRSTTKPAEVNSEGKIIHAPVQHLGVNYNGFIALLTAAMQKQQLKIDSLTQTSTKQDSINRALQDQINQIVNNCCAKGTGSRTSQSNNSNNNNSSGTDENKNIGAINVELSSSNAIVLNDAVPNPFAEQTVIGYDIPKINNQAQILFYDSNGKLIKSVDIKTTGKGQLNVFANDLTNGTYSYTLVVDGKVIATKRMVRQQ